MQICKLQNSNKMTLNGSTKYKRDMKIHDFQPSIALHLASETRQDHSYYGIYTRFCLVLQLVKLVIDGLSDRGNV